MKTWETTLMQFQTLSKYFSSFFSYITCLAFSQLQICILESIEFLEHLFHQCDCLDEAKVFLKREVVRGYY